MKFIHAADLHLDSPFKGITNRVNSSWKERILQSTFKAFDNVISYAIEHQVDFVLLAGDIYDMEDRSVRAQVEFNEQMERLNKESIKVFIVHGNHDALINEDLFLKAPDNVFTFPTEVSSAKFQTKDSKLITISGYSYPNRHVNDRVIEDFPSKDLNADYHIGLLHGNLESSQSRHGNYAPFSTSEILQKDYDYFAFGHIHQYSQITENAYYAGAIQGRHPNEAGEKGCLLIDDESGNLTTTWLKTSVIDWESIEVDVSEESTFNRISEAILQSLSSYEGQDTLIRLSLLLSTDLKNSIQNKLDVDTMDSIIQSKYSNILLTKLSLKRKDDTPFSLQTIFPHAYQTSLNELISVESFQPLLSNLQKQVPRELLEDYQNESVREDLVKRVSQMLMNQ